MSKIHTHRSSNNTNLNPPPKKSFSIYLSIYLSLTNCHFEISLRKKKNLIFKHSISKVSGI